jgi:hypothetical protein
MKHLVTYAEADELRERAVHAPTDAGSGGRVFGPVRLRVVRRLTGWKPGEVAFTRPPACRECRKRLKPGQHVIRFGFEIGPGHTQYGWLHLEPCDVPRGRER